MIRPKLVAITDTHVAPLGILERRLEALAGAAAPGTVALQLRDHDLPARARLELGRRLLDIARRHGQALVVNDRIDIAMALGADGVHLGERSVPVTDVRLLMPNAWISRACHVPEKAGDDADVDAVILSPIVAQRKARPALGTEALSRARALLPARVQLVALGGIAAENGAACIAAGADAVAAIGSVLGGEDGGALLGALGIARMRY